LIRREGRLDTGWVEGETAGCEFADVRLDRRFRELLAQIGDAVGESIPMACQDWANTKAAYRFFSNERVDEGDILEGHFQATHDRFAAGEDTVLVLHDTTEFSFQRESPDRIGITYSVNSGRDKKGRIPDHTVCGILIALKRKVNPTRVPIEKKESIRWLENLKQSTELLGEPERCIHIGDRESDIYELFCTGREIGTHFLVRTCVDRLAGDGDHTVSTDMAKAKIKGRHRIEVRGAHGDPELAELEVKYERLQLRPPIGKQKQYPPLDLTVLHAQERGKPKNRNPIDWKLITDLPVRTPKDAIEKLRWYALRWKIEMFYKILKSGCKAEDLD
jgi:Transposase DNA-binding